MDTKTLEYCNLVEWYYTGLWLSSRVTDEISAQNSAQILAGIISFPSGKYIMHPSISLR